MSMLAPPRAALSWAPTAFGATFERYEVMRRPSRSPAAAWETWGIITVPAGYDRATVEIQHAALLDYEAGWSVARGQWADGWDYAVRAKSTNGLFSSLSPIVDRKQILPATDGSWITCNAAPWLNAPLETLDRIRARGNNRTIVNELAGRDYAATRTPREIPSRTHEFEWTHPGNTGETPLRVARAAVRSGRQVALLTPRGDRVLGTFLDLDTDQNTTFATPAGGEFVETDSLSVACDYNLPAGVALDGSSEYLTVADNALLDPGSSAFSVVVAARFVDAANAVALSKGNLGTADGYGIRRNAAGTLQFFVDGASAAGGPAEASATWFDGDVHVAVGTSTGAAQKLYRDGALTPVATDAVVHGAITNAIALVLGANNAGASGFMALAPGRSFAVYLRELTAAEAQSAAYYFLGYPGYRLPAGAVLLVDLRDDRAWHGHGATIGDLSGNNLTATAVGAPVTRGIPAPLDQLEKAAA